MIKPGNHLYIFLEKELDDAASGVIQRTFGIFPYDYHYIRMNGTMEDYVNKRAAHDERERLVYFFMIYEGQVSTFGELCFRVVFDPQSTPERIQFAATGHALKRIALAGVVENSINWGGNGDSPQYLVVFGDNQEAIVEEVYYLTPGHCKWAMLPKSTPEENYQKYLQLVWYTPTAYLFYLVDNGDGFFVHTSPKDYGKCGPLFAGEMCAGLMADITTWRRAKCMVDHPNGAGYISSEEE
ncbi:MAG: hypothetical protein J3R72DRAFT_426580 [Linnemannia gamsii]|nr:MAG: hypothetical protein J3R72DRAFT_426580 [Linnemannia gamsii]